MTLTYVKGLPTPREELNAIGETTFSMFLYDYSRVFHTAASCTVNHLLNTEKFNKSQWNTHLQQAYGISKRHANGVISSAKGRVSSSIEGRAQHIKVLKQKLSSAKKWLKKSEKKLSSCALFYQRKNWRNAKKSTLLPLSCSVQYRDTNYQHLKFQAHHKKRYIYRQTQQIEHLKNKPVQVKVPRWDCFIVGSKDETWGNQICQWDGNNLRFRVPYCLESKYGSYVSTTLGGFRRNINRIPTDGAKTWHFYLKDGTWKVALQFTPVPVQKRSRSINYGCIGIDLNPGSVDWAYVDSEGNLKQHGKIKLIQGLPKGKAEAQIVDACLKLVKIAIQDQCPIVGEELDFSKKKAKLKEESKQLARMLSSWAYAEFFKLLNAICSNRGIQIKTVNPAYSSSIGLVKYLRQYGISSGVAAAIAIARRGMRLSEKLPRSLTAYPGMKSGKHVWSDWNQLNKLIKSRAEIRNRHSYYGISNWGFLVKEIEPDSISKQRVDDGEVSSTLIPRKKLCTN
ncbi:MAG: IS200/IS605 family accessory protein TnpB-related protein [Pleurocapsa sp. MO_226.B13]|nr:IS200/IS605 family accessory protein TnpB-related protein [Pleurocapsa sp. MO_226.B13]